jgi:heat shock protein HslJ
MVVVCKDLLRLRRTGWQATSATRGSSGCNSYHIELTILGRQRLEFHPQTLLMTAKACQDQAMQQEEKFLRLLPQMTRFIFRDNTLPLSNEQGTLGLQFARTKSTTE